MFVVLAIMSSSDQEVLALCSEIWHWRLAESPELASYFGFHEHDDRWDDISEEAYIKREKCVQDFLKKAKAIDSSLCTQDVALSHAILIDDLELYLRGSPFRSYLMPLTYMEGIHVTCNLTISYMRFDTEEDFNKYIARLEKLPYRIEQVIEVLKRGVQDKIVAFSSTVQAAPRQIQTILDTPLLEVQLLKPFTEDHHTLISPEKLLHFQLKAQHLIERNVFPALETLKTYLVKDYFTHLRPQAGINSLKDGDLWYQQCLDFYLTCSMTPQEVHDIGIREVARIHKLILKLAEEAGLGQSFPEILANTKSQLENHFNSTEEVISYIRDLCTNIIRPRLASLFKNLPSDVMKIESMPEYLRGMAVGLYLSGTADGRRKGCYYINNHNLKLCLPNQLMALSLHEGEPGHHLQGFYALAAHQLPDFRRYNGDTKYYLAPARFGFSTAYAEGWGLYSEALGEELALYTDKLQMLGRLKFEIFRAARLVVDTGIHALGWSRETAIEYMLKNTLSENLSVSKEIDRYICLPGQACAYKIGEIKIWELRHKAEEKLGQLFDIKEFHHQLLSCGAVPLHILEIIVDQYITEVKATN